MSKKGVDISFIKPAMDNDDWKREVTDVEKCLVIVEVYCSRGVNRGVKRQQLWPVRGKIARGQARNQPPSS